MGCSTFGLLNVGLAPLGPSCLLHTRVVVFGLIAASERPTAVPTETVLSAPASTEFSGSTVRMRSAVAAANPSSTDNRTTYRPGPVRWASAESSEESFSIVAEESPETRLQRMSSPGHSQVMEKLSKVAGPDTPSGDTVHARGATISFPVQPKVWEAPAVTEGTSLTSTPTSA